MIPSVWGVWTFSGAKHIRVLFSFYKAGKAEKKVAKICVQAKCPIQADLSPISVHKATWSALISLLPWKQALLSLFLFCVVWTD